MGDRITRERTFIRDGQRVTVRRDLLRGGTGIRVSVKCIDERTGETLWKEHRDYAVVAEGDFTFSRLCGQYRQETSSHIR